MHDLGCDTRGKGIQLNTFKYNGGRIVNCAPTVIFQNEKMTSCQSTRNWLCWWAQRRKYNRSNSCFNVSGNLRKWILSSSPWLSRRHLNIGIGVFVVFHICICAPTLCHCAVGWHTLRHCHANEMLIFPWLLRALLSGLRFVAISSIHHSHTCIDILTLHPMGAVNSQSECNTLRQDDHKSPLELYNLLVW